MTLFILAISDHVDINIKGNMNEPLKRLLEVCIRALRHLEMAKVPAPSVRWVMNQVADPDPELHREGFKRTRDELQEVFKDDDIDLHQIVSLDENNVVIIPSMYNEESHHTFVDSVPNWTRFKPSQSFFDACKLLRSENTVKNSEERPFDGLESWVSLADTTFQTIKRYPDLTYFADIKQVRNNKYMREFMTELIKNSFELQERRQEHEKVVEKLCKENLLEDEALNTLAGYFESLKEPIEEAFDQKAKDLKCDSILHQKLRTVLHHELLCRQSEWIERITTAYQDRSVRGACKDGAKALRDEIKAMKRHQSEPYLEHILEERFEEVWHVILQKMKQRFKKKNVQHELLQRIYNFYPLDSRLKTFDQVQEVLQAAQEATGFKDTDWWMQVPYFEATSQWLKGTSRPPSTFEPAGVFPEWYAFLKPDFRESLELEKLSLGRKMLSPFTSVGMRPGPQDFANQHKKVLQWLASQHADRPPESTVIDAAVAAVDYKKVFSEMIAELDKLIDKSGRADSTLITRIEREVDRYSWQVNQALALMGCELSRVGKNAMHTCAVIHVWNRVREEVWRRFHAPIENFEGQKKMQKEYFVSVLSRSKSADSNSARSLTADYENEIYQKYESDMEGTIHNIVQANSDRLSRTALQSRLDMLLGSNDLKKQQAWVENPKDTLEDEFMADWSAIVETEVHAKQQVKAEKVGSTLAHCETVCDSVRKGLSDLPEATSDVLFEVVGETKDPSHTAQLKRRAAGQWVRDVLCEPGRKHEWRVADDGTEHSVVARDGMLPKRMSPLEDNIFIEVLKGRNGDGDLEVSDLLSFFEALVADLKKLREKLMHKSPLPDNQSLKALVTSKRGALFHKMLPCSERCPCCGRLCDNPDSVEGHTHSCSHGHQVRGFKGIYLEDWCVTDLTFLNACQLRLSFYLVGVGLTHPAEIIKM